MRFFLKSVLVGLVVLLIGLPVTGAGAKDKVIKVGISAGMTGPYGAVGRYIVGGRQDHTKWVNENGGIKFTDPKTGKTEYAKLELLWGDDAYNVSKCISNYKRFAADGTVSFQAPFSGGTLALMPIMKREKVPEIGHPMALEIVEPPGWYFLIWLTYQDAYAGFLKWAKDNWTKDRPMRIAFIGPNTPVGRACLTKGTKAYTKSLGVEIVGDEIIPSQPLNSKPNLLKIKAKHPDYLYCSTLGSVNGKVLKDFYELGMKKETIYVASLGQYSEEGFKIAGKEANEGLLMTNATRLYPSDAKGMKLMMEKFKECQPGKEWNLAYLFGWTGGIATTEAIKRALNKTGYPITGQDVYNAAMTIKDFDMMDIQHPLSWGPDIRAGIDSCFLFEVRDLKWVLKEPKPIKCPHIKRDTK